MATVSGIPGLDRAGHSDEKTILPPARYVKPVQVPFGGRFFFRPGTRASGSSLEKYSPGVVEERQIEKSSNHTSLGLRCGQDLKLIASGSEQTRRAPHKVPQFDQGLCMSLNETIESRRTCKPEFQSAPPKK